MAERKKAKGVFCLEGEWENALEAPSSVKPVLVLLKKSSQYTVPYIRRDIGTMAEFEFYVDKALQARYSEYPILYLAFHGAKGRILVGDRRKAESKVTLEVLEELLANRCKGRIIYFGACDTMGVHGSNLNRFLKKTGALAVCGYTKTVDWIRSAAFDLLVLDAMQRFSFTRRGAVAMEKQIMHDAPHLRGSLGSGWK
jgi:hypothetical protein